MLLSALLLPALLAALAGAVPARSPPPPPPGQSAADGALPADILCSAFGGGPHCKGSPEPAPATPGRGRRQAEDATVDLCALFGGPDCPTEAPVTGIECDCPDKSGDRCECVSFYHCNSTGADNVDGVGLHGGCPLYEHVCCKIDIPKDKRETPEPHKDPGRGRRQAQAATADEQQQQQCAIFGGAACGPARDKRQEQAEQGAEIDPELLCGIFAGPNCTSEQQNKVYDPCTCPAGSGDGCECVPYYNCDGETGNYNTDGVGVIDIRQKQDREGYDASAPNSTCSHYLQQCCRVREGQGPAPGPAPGPDPGPDPGPVTDEPWTQPQRPPPGPGPQPLKKPKCGVRHKNGIGDRISGALHDETNYGEIPWMVAIFKKRQAEHDYVCGGGLIAPNVVMTAAHCVNEKTPSNLKIRAGEWDSRTTDERYPHQDRDVAEIITHPDYKPQALHNDVALLVLREPVRLSGHIGHIGTLCLPDQGQNFDHRTCLVSGWGKDVFGKEGVYQNIMRRIDDLPVVPYAQCQEKLRRTRVGPYFRLNKSFMCAGGVKGRDACTGDGGSPLACPITDSENTRYKFAGIVSWGVGCGEEDVPGVYADVAQFRSWIDDQLATRGITLPRADDGDD